MCRFRRLVHTEYEGDLPIPFFEGLSLRLAHMLEFMHPSNGYFLNWVFLDRILMPQHLRIRSPLIFKRKHVMATHHLISKLLVNG